jgi:hypothetical protein
MAVALPPPVAYAEQHLSFEEEPEDELLEEPAIVETVPHPRLAAATEEGTPVTRFEFYPHDDDADEPDFLEEAHADEEDDELPAPRPPLAPSLSFDDDEGEDEDAGRAPRSTLDDIASELERYLAAEFNNPARGNAEIGDDVVGLPGQQNK